MTDFSSSPAPLTPAERWIATAAAVATAFTRLLAVARSPWDWDEMLFLLAMRDYDVALHHPHPPGFPLFIAFAKAFEALGVAPFRSLQLINLIAGVLIVPAMLLLCRELRFSFATSISAALIFSFLPNVWFFGGTGFSDVSAIVLAIAACGLLLRGARSPRALIAGAIVLAVASAFRPQNLLVGFAPALIGSWMSIRRGRVAATIVAAACGFVILVASFGGAVLATGDWDRYLGAVIAHQDYLAATDSFRSPIRPPLFKVSDDFFVRPFRFGAMNVVLSLLAAISLIVAIVRKRVPVLLAIAMFGPFWIVAWLTLDFHSASRFSIGYMPLLAILVADAVWLIARRSQIGGAAMTMAIAGTLAVWMLPGLNRVRGEESPPVRAARLIAEEFTGETTVYVQKRMRPFAEYYLHDSPLVHLEETAPHPSQVRGEALYLQEGKSSVRGARTYAWPRNVLWNVARRRYFEVSVAPLPSP